MMLTKGYLKVDWRRETWSAAGSEVLTCIIAASEPAGTSPLCAFEALDSAFCTSASVRWKVSSVPDILIVWDSFL